jgi:hypothetical protein
MDAANAEDPDVIIRKHVKPMKMAKVFTRGMYHLVDLATRHVFTYDPTHIHYIWMGTLNAKDELEYRPGWETDMKKAVDMVMTTYTEAVETVVKAAPATVDSS